MMPSEAMFWPTLKYELFLTFSEENFVSDHLGESLHIVDAEGRHGKLLRIVAQAGEIKKHLPKIVIKSEIKA